MKYMSQNIDPMVYAGLTNSGKYEYFSKRFPKKNTNLNCVLNIDFHLLKNAIKNEFSACFARNPKTDRSIRKYNTVIQKKAITYLLYQYKNQSGMGVVTISKFWGCDHSTVIHYLKCVKIWLEVGTGYELEIKALEQLKPKVNKLVLMNIINN